jgi:hypothetical protein
MVEIERKFSGVISDAGIITSNSASTASIRLTMSIEVSPISVSWSSVDTGRVIEFFVSISLTRASNRSLGTPVPGSSISSLPESSGALKGCSRNDAQVTHALPRLKFATLPPRVWPIKPEIRILREARPSLECRANDNILVGTEPVARLGEKITRIMVNAITLDDYSGIGQLL